MSVLHNRYVLRSAIQKAVRRGWADILVLAGKKLLEHDKQWLLSRIPIIACEDHWTSVGLLGELFPRIKNGDSGALKELFRYWMLHPATQEAPALATCATKFYTSGGVVRQKEVIIYRKLTEDKAEPDYAAAIGKLIGSGKLPDYLVNCLSVLKYRASFRNGNNGDKSFLLAAAVLLAVRAKEWEKEDFESVKQLPIRHIEDDPDIVVADGIPWMAYDMHTRVGRFAIGLFAKKYAGNLSRDDVGTLFWNYGSGFIPEFRKVKECTLLDGPFGPEDEVWFALAKQGTFVSPYEKAHSKHPISDWITIRDKLAKVVKWVVEKRLPENAWNNEKDML
jgi:hypothetical protein